MDPGDEPRTPTWTPTSTPTRAAAAATVTLDDLLAAAARTVPAAPQAERRAVAAFRAARDAGAPAVPTRRRDDWRPARPRIRARWIKVGLGSFVAALMLGGVAMAAGAIPAPFGDGHGPGPVPSASPSRDGGTTAPGGPFVPVPPKVGPAGPTGDERPPTAKDQLAQCRAYEARHGRPGSLDSPAWQRLEDAMRRSRRRRGVLRRPVGRAASPAAVEGTPVQGREGRRVRGGSRAEAVRPDPLTRGPGPTD